MYSVKKRKKYHFGASTNLHLDIFKQLIVEGVGAVELQHQIVREDVLDALDDVLRLRFRQLRRLARLKI